MSDLPKGWRRIALAEVVESAVDGPFGSNLKTEHYVSSPGVRVIRLQNIGAGYFNDRDRAYIDKRHARTLSRHEVQSGDLLVASLGDENHPVARACSYPAGVAPAIVKADCFRLRPRASQVISSYLTLVLNSFAGRRGLEGYFQGITRDRINLSALLRYRITVPPLGEQRRIAEILDALDRRIVEEGREVAKRRLLREAALRKALAPAIRLIASVDTSRIGQVEGVVEEGWTPVRLGSLLTRIEAGASPDLEDRPAGHGEWGVLKVSAVGPQGFRPEENKVAPDRMLHRQDLCVTPGDLIMTRANTSDLVGLSCVVPEVESCLMLSDKTLRLVVDHRQVSAEFVDIILSLSEVRTQIQVAATGTSASMKNISQSAIRALVVPSSDSLNMERVCRIDSEMRTLIEKQQATVMTLQDLKQGLVEDLLTGRVRV